VRESRLCLKVVQILLIGGATHTSSRLHNPDARTRQGQRQPSRTRQSSSRPMYTTCAVSDVWRMDEAQLKIQNPHSPRTYLSTARIPHSPFGNSHHLTCVQAGQCSVVSAVAIYPESTSIRCQLPPPEPNPHCRYQSWHATQPIWACQCSAW
jgi:hypothetical protein